MIFEEYSPREELAPFIKSYIMIEDGDGLMSNQTMSIYPSGHLEMIISFGESVYLSNGNYHLKNAAGYLGGQILEPLYYRPAGRLRVLSVIFKPSALYRLIGVPQKVFTGYTIDLEVIFGKKGSELIERICMAQGRLEKILVFEGYFIRLLKDVENRIDSVVIATNLIEKWEGKISIKALSDYLNVNIKTLERNFTQQIGITPKEFSRIIRFNKAFNDINSGSPDIHDLIHKYGYYDQSHFIGEFRRFTALNPSSFLKRDKGGVDYSLREKVKI